MLLTMAATLLACGSDVDARFVNNWKLVEIDGEAYDTDLYMDLRDDGTYDARWIDMTGTDAEDISGTWYAMEYGEGDIDLFLFIGEEDSRIFTVSAIGEGQMTCNIEGIPHVFK